MSNAPTGRKIEPGERLGGEGESVGLRLLELADCTERYHRWLADPVVNEFLETRYAEQTPAAIRSFVASLIDSPHSYLFAIVDASAGHIGNIKIGPVVPRHLYADVSYFIGERDAWGKGYGTAAVRIVTRFGFERLGLHRCQAGLYESNIGSHRVLEKAGYALDGRLSKQLRIGDRWEDHVWFAALRDTWT